MRLRIGISNQCAFLHRVFETFPYAAVVSTIIGEAECLRLKIGSGDNHKRIFWNIALRTREQVRIEGDLQYSVSLRLPCKLCIDDLVGPLAQHARRFDPMQYVSTSTPTRPASHSPRVHGIPGQDRLANWIIAQPVVVEDGSELGRVSRPLYPLPWVAAVGGATMTAKQGRLPGQSSLRFEQKSPIQ